MEVLILAYDYSVWHYTRALDDFFDASTNFLWLIHRSFSHPAKRMNERFSSWPLRPIGIIACFLSVFAGLLVLISALLLETLLLLFWILLPLILLALLYLAFQSVTLPS